MSEENNAVQSFYEAFPYPQVGAGGHSLGDIFPSSLLGIAHYIYGGSLPRTRPLRVLVAGGGTGNAPVSLANQCRAEGLRVKVDYLDLSHASLEIARARAMEAGIDVSGFRQGQIEELLNEPPNRYDYIDLCGVINHVAEPDMVLRALRHALAATGGIGVMAYGMSGRSGVYQFQDAIRVLGLSRSRESISAARTVFNRLPNNHPLKTNPNFATSSAASDTEFADCFFNPRDQAFSVATLVNLFGSAGLRIQEFMPPIMYDPAAILKDPDLKTAASRLDRQSRWHLGELLVGTLHKHTFYAVPSASPLGHEAALSNQNTKLVGRKYDLRELSRGLAEHGGSASIPFSFEAQARSLKVRFGRLEMKALACLSGGCRLRELAALIPDETDADRQAAVTKVVRMLNSICCGYLIE